MVAVAEESGNLFVEYYYQQSKRQRRRSDSTQCRGVYFLRVLTLPAHETEERCLHSIGKDYYQERHIGIDVRDDSVLSSGSIELRCLDWHKEIVYEPCHDRAQSIYYSVLSQ